MKSYRPAFLVAVTANLVLAAVLLGIWWRGRTNAALQPKPGPPANAVSQTGDSGASAPASAEAALAPVHLSVERMQSIGVQFGAVEYKSLHDDIRTTGSVAIDETRLAYVQTRFAGYIQKVFVDATYRYVRRGQPLFTIYSPELVAAEREYLVARRNQSALSESTVPGVAGGGASLLAASVERLKQWNIPPREIARLESSGKVEQDMEIDSPVSGYVIERNALPNAYVQPSTRIYTVADLSTVWVFAQVFQNDLGRVRVGAPAILTVDAYPGRTFQGRVDFIYPDVDMTTRSARVRLVFRNPRLTLTPGMFVNVDLQTPLGRRLVIPSGGVLQSGERSVVFVDRGDGYLAPRDVTLGPLVGDDYIVQKGLKAGERIVTSANFLIDSESQLQAALGAFVPPPPGAGPAGAAAAPQAGIEFSSTPSPPRKGDNVFRVRLTDAGGKSITGATVTVTFFMPAMPAMGMAAMRQEFSLPEKDGLYQGSAALPSGGTWQVTVVARRNGQVIASRQLSVSAGGGR